MVPIEKISLFLRLFTMREKFPNTEFFLVRFFRVFGLNTGKYEPKKTPYLVVGYDPFSN